MLSLSSLARCCGSGSAPILRTVTAVPSRQQSGGPPPKLECFIDGKKVLVDPGTTVLQVILSPWIIVYIMY